MCQITKKPYLFVKYKTRKFAWWSLETGQWTIKCLSQHMAGEQWPMTATRLQTINEHTDASVAALSLFPFCYCKDEGNWCDSVVGESRLHMMLAGWYALVGVVTGAVCPHLPWSADTADTLPAPLPCQVRSHSHGSVNNRQTSSQLISHWWQNISEHCEILTSSLQE